MNSRIHARPYWPALVFAQSLFIFILGFFISYHQEQNRAQEEGGLTWLHLNYVLDQKDDMAVIDWSRNFEKLDSVAGFRVKSGAKILADGGNRVFLPAVPRPGVSYIPPARWIFTGTATKNSENSRELVLVFHFFPSPPVWGLILTSLFLLSWGMGWVFTRVGSPPSVKADTSRELNLKIAEEKTVQFPSEPSLAANPSYLFLDRKYVIQRIGPTAEELLQIPSGELLQGHLFDLQPDPGLTEAIEKNLEVKLLNPFISRPHLAVRLQPDPLGTLLFLERKEATKPPQKH